MTSQFAVIGTPVAHSLSPVIHNAVFHHERRDARMVAHDPLTEEALVDDLHRWLADATYAGLAVTAPYKPLVASIASERSETVEALGAANTMTRVVRGSADPYWRAQNTDVAGFTHAVQRLLTPLAYRTFVVFGTGATARTIVFALIRANAAQIHVVGRSLEKARACIDFTPAGSFACIGSDALVVNDGATELVASTVPPGKRFDCAINATTLGLSASDGLVFPLAWFAEYAANLFDVVYRPHGTTRLVAEARQQGVSALDGRAMLMAQAIEQARIWGATSRESELLEVITEALEGRHR